MVMVKNGGVGGGSKILFSKIYLATALFWVLLGVLEIAIIL